MEVKGSTHTGSLHRTAVSRHSWNHLRLCSVVRSLSRSGALRDVIKGNQQRWDEREWCEGTDVETIRARSLLHFNNPIDWGSQKKRKILNFNENCRKEKRNIYPLRRTPIERGPHPYFDAFAVSSWVWFQNFFCEHEKFEISFSMF